MWYFVGLGFLFFWAIVAVFWGDHQTTTNGVLLTDWLMAGMMASWLIAAAVCARLNSNETKARRK